MVQIESCHCCFSIIPDNIGRFVAFIDNGDLVACCENCYLGICKQRVGRDGSCQNNKKSHYFSGTNLDASSL